MEAEAEVERPRRVVVAADCHGWPEGGTRHGRWMEPYNYDCFHLDTTSRLTVVSILVGLACIHNLLRNSDGHCEGIQAFQKLTFVSPFST